MLTKPQYILLNQFPKNKSYVKISKIEKMRTNKLLFDITTIAHQLYDLGFLNGSSNDLVGLRITPEGLRALAEYKDKNKTETRALKVSKIAIGLSIVAILITVITKLLSRYKIWPFDK